MEITRLYCRNVWKKDLYIFFNIPADTRNIGFCVNFVVILVVLHIYPYIRIGCVLSEEYE
jgi:hypothetical protein